MVQMLSTGDPEIFPGQMGYIIPAACFGSAPGSPPSWTCLIDPNMNASGGHSIVIRWQCHHNWLFLMLSSIVSLRSFQTSKLLVLSLLANTNTCKKMNFNCLYTECHSFRHYPVFMTTSQSWNKDQLVIWLLRPQAQQERTRHKK